MSDAFAHFRRELVGADCRANGNRRPTFERKNNEVTLLDAAPKSPNLADVVCDLPTRGVRVEFAVQVCQRFPVVNGRKVWKLLPSNSDNAFFNCRLLGIAVLTSTN